MSKDRTKTPHVEKINWVIGGRKPAQVCAVMPWAEYEHLEQSAFERGWEQRRLYDEKRQVDYNKKLQKKK